MKKISYISVLIFMLMSVFSSNSQTMKNNIAKTADSKKKIKIVVTDSGLGGLSVVEDIALKMKKYGLYEKAEIIFANALFDANSGYNRLTDRKEKIRIFDKAISGIEKTYKPDYIFIACNTLSVLYPETEFSKHTKTKVITIVDYGVNLINKYLQKDKNSNVIIFGTKTTVAEDTYGKLLRKKGIDKNRIVSQACPELQEYIERDPKGEKTFKMISKFVGEALNKLKDNDKDLYISLNCTHYGYAGNLWEKAFKQNNSKLSGVLNPNYEMSKILFQKNEQQTPSETELKISVVSKVKLAEKNINSMTNLFKSSCPELAKALKNYELKQDLFSY